MLLGNQSSEEDCRNVVAGCLGQLALLAPDRIVPVIFQHMEQGAASQRVVMITALRMAVTDQPHPVDQRLVSVLPQTLQKLTDPDWWATQYRIFTDTVNEVTVLLLAGLLLGVVLVLIEEDGFC